MFARRMTKSPSPPPAVGDSGPVTTGMTLLLIDAFNVDAKTVPLRVYVMMSAPITVLRLVRIEAFSANSARATSFEAWSSCASTLASRFRLISEIETNAVISVAMMKSNVNGKTILYWIFKRR